MKSESNLKFSESNWVHPKTRFRIGKRKSFHKNKVFFCHIDGFIKTTKNGASDPANPMKTDQVQSNRTNLLSSE